VGLFTIEGYGVPVGFRPMPARPTFTVWGPDVALDGGRWVDMWDLAYDSRPGAEALVGNPLRRVDLRHGKDQTRDGRFVAVTTIPRVPATAAPTNRQGGSPTSLIDAAGAAEARIVHIAADVTGSDDALMDPDGQWEDGDIAVVGTKWPARVRRLGDHWLAVLELDAVYVGLVAFKVPAHTR
jgi:hypothetical protein